MHCAHFFKGGDDKIDAHVVIAFFKLTSELTHGRVLQHRYRGLQIFSDVFKPVGNIFNTRAENALGAGYLRMKQLGLDMLGAVMGVYAKGPAYRGQENLFHQCLLSM